MRAPDPLTLPLDRVVALALERHHLDARPHGDDVVGVMDDLLGLHATVPTSPDLQLRARMPTYTRTQLDALLDAGRVARVGCMRCTLFLESAPVVPLVLAATRELTLRGRDRFLAAYGWSPGRYQQMADRVAAVLAGRTLDARQLREAVGATEPLSPVLLVMCDDGHLVRWSGAAGWRSTRPRYRLLAEALPQVRLDAWDPEAALVELVARYIRSYGPVSEADVAWWTGRRTAAVRAALGSLDHLVRVRVDGLAGAFVLHEADVGAFLHAGADRERTVALLPVLDPYLQGHRDRTRFVDPRWRHHVVDRSGNATSVILLDGRVAGVWDLVGRPGAEVRLLLFETVDAGTRRRVRALAADLAGFVAGEAVPVVEVDRMDALTDRSAGHFRSPLAEGSRSDQERGVVTLPSRKPTPPG